MAYFYAQLARAKTTWSFKNSKKNRKNCCIREKKKWSRKHNFENQKVSNLEKKQKISLLAVVKLFQF